MGMEPVESGPRGRSARALMEVSERDWTDAELEGVMLERYRAPGVTP